MPLPYNSDAHYNLMKLWVAQYPASRFYPIGPSALHIAVWCGCHMHAAVSSLIVHQHLTGTAVFVTSSTRLTLKC